MKRMSLLTLSLLALVAVSVIGLRIAAGQAKTPDYGLIGADNKDIQYAGRIDFSNPKKPRFWAPGVYLHARFRGPYCAIVVNDEVLYGTSHNYLEVVIDDHPPVRLQTNGPTNTIPVAAGLFNGPHTITVCKDTEAGIGYVEFLGFRCQGLLPLPPKPARKLEFIGDSITCGAGSDQSEKPCGQGQWYDQNNAYLSYGPTTAQALHAQWHLTAVSGIGLIHSCCDMTITMPQVFDKMNPRDNTGTWDFQHYQPDAVTICLGQNDGAQDPATFCGAYVQFIKQLRANYPKAQIICLNSPMADPALTAYLKTNLTRVVNTVHQDGDPNVHTFFFSRRYDGGCGGHPDLVAHRLMAGELSAFLKSTLGW